MIYRTWPPQLDSRERTIEDAVVELADIPLNIRGNSISICTILAERGELDLDIAILGAWVIQRAFDARKHRVDLGALLDSYEKLKLVRPASERGSCLSIRVKAPKNASGYDAKKAAWKHLVEWARAAPLSMCAIEKAMVARILILDEKFGELGLLLDRYEIPSVLKKAAQAELEKDPHGERQRSRMEELATLYLKKERYQRLHPVATAQGPDAGRDELCAITAQVEAQYRAGILSAAAMIGYGVQGWAAKLVSASDIERIATAVPSEGEAYLLGHGWQSGVYEINQLRPAPSTRGNFALLVKVHRYAEVRFLEQKPQSTKVWLRAFSRIRPDSAHGG